ncbi:hypothetical protein [Shinella sp.]|jgi:hypothetical protein|uniref:hypothetical protein n=1 Tax=Shinella sp. TaxID=1870904 RepID=UPI003F6F8EB1
MSFFDEFAQIRKDQAAWRAEARNNFVPGVDPVELKPGQKVTISPNLQTGDRSYTRDIHEVVAINAAHVQTRIPDFMKERPTRLVMLLVHEHHFYIADGFEADAPGTKDNTNG